MKILMVCLGNICRSPMAEGILRKMIDEKNLSVQVDSAGTGSWHTGERPDRRAISTAKKFGVDISKLVARQIEVSDFEYFDKIFVMDKSNYRNVVQMARSKEDSSKVELLMNLCFPGSDTEVPDPWSGDEDGFIPVFKMMEKACSSLIASLKIS